MYSQNRSSCYQMFFKVDVLKIFGTFTRKYLCWSLFLIKLQAWRTIIKKKLQHRCFPVKFAKFIKTPFLTEHLQWLLQSKVDIQPHHGKYVPCKVRKIYLPILFFQSSGSTFMTNLFSSLHDEKSNFSVVVILQYVLSKFVTFIDSVYFFIFS